MRERTAWVSLAILSAVFVGAWRFLALPGFANDHYVHMAGAQQIVLGEWPSRDFVDAGAPLMFGLSAIVYWIMPDTPLFGEALLMAIMFGVSAAATVYATRRLTGSIALALLAVAVEIVIFPRTYSYPKILTYAVGFLAMWRYVDRPTTARLVQLAVVVVLSFLLRYDHGLYLGAGGLLTVALTFAKDGTREVARRTVTYVLLLVVLLAPYVLYVAWYDGLWHHVLRGMEARALEDSRGRRPPAFLFTQPLTEGNAVAWLYYLFHLLPFITAVTVYMRWRRSPDPRELAMVVPLLFVAVPMNLGLIRDTLIARLPDAVVPATFQLAWLLARVRGLRARPVAVLGWSAAAVLVFVTGASVAIVGATKEQLDRAQLLEGLPRAGRQFVDRTTQLRARFPAEQIPSRVAYALLPFFAYADRCLARTDHILVPAFLPEVAVWARRPFAGGQILFQSGSLATESDHRLVMDRMRMQRVPVTVLVPTSDPVLAQFDELASYVRDHFQDVAVLSIGDGRTIRLGFDRRLASGRDGPTGWLCYR
jgi:hypothetical protein